MQSTLPLPHLVQHMLSDCVSQKAVAAVSSTSASRDCRDTTHVPMDLKGRPQLATRLMLSSRIRWHHSSASSAEKGRLPPPRSRRHGDG